MQNEIELISDGDGVAIVGSPTAVEEFLASLTLTTRPMALTPSASDLDFASSTVTRLSTGVDRIGRWIEASEETIHFVESLGLMPTGLSGITHTVLAKSDVIKGWVKAAQEHSELISNPALFSGVAGVMTQTAIQASLQEITDYLKRIDEKLDDVLRAQTNAALAKVDGVRFALEEALAIKAAVGKVSDVTWSKIQTTTTTLFETESYALRQIQDEAGRLRLDTPIADLYEAVRTIETNIPMWLTILANCSSLYDSIAILELDRVFASNPDDLDSHRVGLKAAREKRLKTIASALEMMLGKLSTSVDRANSKVLLNPIQTPKTVESCRTIAISLIEVSTIFGFTTSEEKAEAKRWVEAASERIEATRQATAGTAEAVHHVSREAASTAKALKGKMAEKLGDRKRTKGEP